MIARNGRPGPIGIRRLDEAISSYAPLVEQARGRLEEEAQALDVDWRLKEFLAAGKMLRGVLVLASGGLAGADQTILLDGVVAVELLHAASLIHDDICDGSTERRCMPALHAQIGVPAAILIADLFMMRAFANLAAPTCVPTASSSQRARAISSLSEQAAACCAAAIWEAKSRGQGWTPESYIGLVISKTGSQFAAAVTVGAALGDADRSLTDALRTYGLDTGTAYQIRDDLVDVAEDAGSGWLPQTNDARAWARGAQREQSLAAQRALSGLPDSRHLRALAALAQFAATPAT